MTQTQDYLNYCILSKQKAEYKTLSRLSRNDHEFSNRGIIRELFSSAVHSKTLKKSIFSGIIIISIFVGIGFLYKIIKSSSLTATLGKDSVSFSTSIDPSQGNDSHDGKNISLGSGLIISTTGHQELSGVVNTGKK